jgi:hypothetical protein
LVYGTVVHVVHLARGGLDPYPGLLGWLAWYFVSLTVLDPAAAVLLHRRRRSGLVLACLVLVTDAAANGYATYVLDAATGITPGRIGQAVITILAGALTTASPWLWIAFRPAGHPEFVPRRVPGADRTR